MKKYIWLDCDPGVDDAAAILLANKSEKYELVGISTVSGNVSQKHTFNNARNIVELIGAKVPVFAGADKPIFGQAVDASHIHGENGLGDVIIPESKTEPETLRAWDAMYEAVLKYKDELEVVAVGPLTNLAIALMKYPDLNQRLKRVIIMGGSAGAGNVTPAAEFNIWEDPEAASAIFESGINIVMFGLDVTMQAYLTDEDLSRMKKLGSKEAEFLSDSFQNACRFIKKYNLPGVSVHDACTVIYLEKPEIFRLEKAWARVETQGSVTRGMTVTDLYSDKQMETKNAEIALEVDRDAFISILFAMMSRY